ncbi:MAG: urate hydroxylase PuuD [Pseudomonadota bacterium]
MYDLAAMWAWLDFAVRWIHVITGIAWIGSSFYFIALDLGLREAENMPDGVKGEEWQVHGGGFYHIRKYMVAPAAMPEHLTWFKWEAYSTWLSGAALLAIVYWAGAELLLIDPSKADLATWQAIVISATSLTLGWLIYDHLCKSKLGYRPTALMLLLFILLVVMAWGYDQIFTGRAALLHLGAFTATIMSANVFFIIIPNQKVVVADLKAGRTPDPDYGRIAKLRSTHNNYLTLPVLFLMLSNHYPLAFATEYNWVIASLVFLMGVTIRHWFNERHAGTSNPSWTWAVTALLFIAIMGLSTVRLPTSSEPDVAAFSKISKAEQQEAIEEIVLGRCSMCHARDPVWEGLHWPPKGLVLETSADIARAAEQIYLQAGVTNAMPPANVTLMEADERHKIMAWYQNAKSSLQE